VKFGYKQFFATVKHLLHSVERATKHDQTELSGVDCSGMSDWQYWYAPTILVAYV